jgi:dihydrofolate reductase
MGKLVYGMHQSLDGYIAGLSGGPELFAPGPLLFRHFLDHVSGVAGMLYGTRIYKIMQYWDNEQPGWGQMEHDFAEAWRSKRKWVASRSLEAVGSNATLVSGDLEDFARHLKAEVEGEIDVAGATLAGSLSKLGLVDEYRLYFRPMVLGAGKPFFAAARPRLRLLKTEQVGEDAALLTYVPLPPSQ